MNVSELRELLGQNVVLLRCQTRTKKPIGEWGRLTVADMTLTYLHKLEGENIGVVLGEKSGHLIALDIDADEMVKPFLDSNPPLNATLQTRGARGAVFWLRMAGEYPAKTVKLKTHSGGDCGEFRSNGSQSIIHGIHPNGNPYQVVKIASPLVVDFKRIVWPAEISNPPTLPADRLANDTERQSDGVPEKQSNRVTDETEAIVCSSVSLSLHLTIDQAVQMALPDGIHQNNERLFTLARAVKTLECQSGKFTPAQLREIFNRWYALATKFLRPGLSRADYMVQFLNAYASAKIPLGEGAITEAWKLAQKNPLPPESLPDFPDGNMRLVVALCRELQIMAGREPFFLSARTVQRLLKQDGHATAARWLKSLCVLQILTETEKGSGIRASRYLFNFETLNANTHQAPALVEGI